MRRRSLLVCIVLVASLVQGEAHAALSSCVLSGAAGSWSVKKINTFPYTHGMSLDVQPTLPVDNVSDQPQGHMFGGIWILRAATLDTYSYLFLDRGANFAPSRARITFQGTSYIDQPAPTADNLRGLQGAWSIDSVLDPGSYYAVAFGAGYGTYSATVDLSGVPVTCTDVPISQGRVLDFDATKFTGGIQILGPGYGTASGATLYFNNPRSLMLGGLFAYEPAPLPAATMSVNTEVGGQTFRNEISNVNTSNKSFTFSTTYTGKTNTILIDVAQIELAGTG